MIYLLKIVCLLLFYTTNIWTMNFNNRPRDNSSNTAHQVAIAQHKWQPTDQEILSAVTQNLHYGIVVQSCAKEEDYTKIKFFLIDLWTTLAGMPAPLPITLPRALPSATQLVLSDDARYIFFQDITDHSQLFNCENGEWDKAIKYHVDTGYFCGNDFFIASSNYPLQTSLFKLSTFPSSTLIKTIAGCIACTTLPEKKQCLLYATEKNDSELPGRLSLVDCVHGFIIGKWHMPELSSQLKIAVSKNKSLVAFARGILYNQILQISALEPKNKKLESLFTINIRPYSIASFNFLKYGTLLAINSIDSATNRLRIYDFKQNSIEYELVTTKPEEHIQTLYSDNAYTCLYENRSNKLMKLECKPKD